MAESELLRAKGILGTIMDKRTTALRIDDIDEVEAQWDDGKGNYTYFLVLKTGEHAIAHSTINALTYTTYPDRDAAVAATPASEKTRLALRPTAILKGEVAVDPAAADTKVDARVTKAGK